MLIQGVPKQADKSKVIKHIKNLQFLGCQYNQNDRKCWLFDISYEDSWIFSYNSHYESVFDNNAKSVKFCYWDCLGLLWWFWSFYYLKNIHILKVFTNNAKYDLKSGKIFIFVKNGIISTPKLWFSAFSPENVSPSYWMF